LHFNAGLKQKARLDKESDRAITNRTFLSALLITWSQDGAEIAMAHSYTVVLPGHKKSLLRCHQLKTIFKHA